MREERFFSGVCLPLPTKRLESLLPIIESNIRNRDLDFGEGGYGDYGTNCLSYDDGVWSISFDFSLWLTGCGSKGKVSNLNVECYDEESEEEMTFDDDELFRFREDIEDILCDLA